MSKAFAARLLKGEGLGKTLEGMAEPIQIRRREESLGLGCESSSTKGNAEKEWGDWWKQAFNDAASKIKPAHRHEVLSASESSSSDDEYDSHTVMSRMGKPRYTARGLPLQRMQVRASCCSRKKRRQTQAEEACDQEVESSRTGSCKKRKKCREGEHQEKQLQEAAEARVSSQEKDEATDENMPSLKRQKKKKRSCSREEDEADEAETTFAALTTTTDSDEARDRKKKKRKQQVEVEAQHGEQDEETAVEERIKVKHKKKHSKRYDEDRG
ncbi:g-patch domain-containing protein [Cyclospora cayetanensis]|uniref:G-patch domain-containing protein n=1 Tax=Cyclospora cayetanensis TaxID=88456 RepID=A0A1D3D0J9_9EIME|nr:g-patch domain-containing protein [Cyclospora cayetanensis]